MRHTITHRLLAALVVALGTSAPARAEMVTAELNGSTLGTILNPSAAVTINLGDGSAASVNYYPGVVNWINYTSGPSSLSHAFTTFCIELTQDISPGNKYTYSLIDLQYAPKPGSSKTGSGQGMGAAKANKIAQLWAADYGKIGSNGTDAAAFQLAIWKIEYDYNTAFTGNDWFTSGNFRATANTTATQLATTWLQGIWTNNNAPAATNLIALDSMTAQDQVTQLTTPVPPTAYLAAAGLGVVVLVRWRKRAPAAGAA